MHTDDDEYFNNQWPDFNAISSTWWSDDITDPNDTLIDSLKLQMGLNS